MTWGKPFYSAYEYLRIYFYEKYAFATDYQYWNFCRTQHIVNWYDNYNILSVFWLDIHHGTRGLYLVPTRSCQPPAWLGFTPAIWFRFVSDIFEHWCQSEVFFFRGKKFTNMVLICNSMYSPCTNCRRFVWAIIKLITGADIFVYVAKHDGIHVQPIRCQHPGTIFKSPRHGPWEDIQERTFCTSKYF